MHEKYRLMVAEEAKRRLRKLEETGATRPQVRRTVAFELACRRVARTVNAGERLDLLETGIAHGLLKCAEVSSEDCSLDCLIQKVLRGFSDARPRIAI